MITFAVLAVCAQVVRNWLMLHAIGVNVSVFDAMALAMFSAWPTSDRTEHRRLAAVLILGEHGIAATTTATVCC